MLLLFFNKLELMIQIFLGGEGMGSWLGLLLEREYYFLTENALSCLLQTGEL